MKPGILRPSWLALATLTTLSCALFARPDIGAPSDTPTPLPRATPASLEPAAGLCGEAEGDEVVMRLEPGIPDPRCIIVRDGQHLRVINHTGAEVNLGLGPYSLVLPANGETVIGPPFGDFLMPGVHILQVDPCCGGELWLRSNAE